MSGGAKRGRPQLPRTAHGTIATVRMAYRRESDGATVEALDDERSALAVLAQWAKHGLTPRGLVVEVRDARTGAWGPL